MYVHLSGGNYLLNMICTILKGVSFYCYYSNRILDSSIPKIKLHLYINLHLDECDTFSVVSGSAVCEISLL